MVTHSVRTAGAPTIETLPDQHSNFPFSVSVESPTLALLTAIALGLVMGFVIARRR